MSMLDSSELDLTGESREVIEAYRLFAQDQGWQQRLRDAVSTGLTAEAAVERVQDELRLRVARAGRSVPARTRCTISRIWRAGCSAIWAARRTVPPFRATRFWSRAPWGPAELLDYGRNGVVALVLEDAAATAHVAIVARAMRIPVVGSHEGHHRYARGPATSSSSTARPAKTHLRPPRGNRGGL